MKQLDFADTACPPTRIKVIGVGGGGSNAVDGMIDLGLTGVEFFNINTDMQALSLSKSPNRLHIGQDVTGGMGCGGDPSVGEKAALASKEEIAALLDDCEMVFIAAGLGGGTGTGAAPVVAEIAKSMGLLTVAIVTKPFSFEGPQRMRRAEGGLARLSKFVDTKIVILNDKLMEIIGPKTQLTEAFRVANEVLARGVQAISDLISVPGVINVDFADVRSVMGETGGAVMGVGVGKGENRASEAVKKACSSPLLEKIQIEGARGVLISITASADVSLQEVNTATQTVYEMADPEANIIFGLVINPEIKDEMRVTIIATGFPDEETRKGANGAVARPVAPVPAPAREETLVSPRTELDLETKLKAMMAPRGEKRDVGEAAGSDSPLPRFPQPNPRPVPATGQTASRTAWPGEEVPEPRPAPAQHQAMPAEEPVDEPEAVRPAEQAVDVETPAYLRRRKRHLFE